MEIPAVDLGFAEEQDSWLLTNRYFPSKIGGKVAWLELENIPDSQELNCDYCNEPCTFLCQIYAPSEKNVTAFHRTIYVFICQKAKCCGINQSGNIKVLRSQLPLKNKFYPDTPPDESVQGDPINPSFSLCNICSCKAPMICGRCKKVNYCGQLHQKIDWKNHKKICGKEGNSSENSFTDNDNLFPEYEIVIEREEKSTNENRSESEKDAERRRLREYEEMINNGNYGSSDIKDNDLKDVAESKEDKIFGRFKKAIEEYPTQVIRYNRNGQVLWISKDLLLDKDVPKCPICKGRRKFEFQIMPQMLNELKNYNLDWGIIAVFTCESDCNIDNKYVAEYSYKQDITKSDDECSESVDINKLQLSNETNEKSKSEESKIPSSSSTNRKKNNRDNKNPQPKKAFQENDEWE